MKTSRFAVGLVGIALAGLWYFAGGTESLPASAAADAPPRVAAPVAHENLSVYFLYAADAVPDAKVMNLQEALERDLAVVNETSNVNVLSVENRSPDTELFIQSGDIVKGGKQDRMAQTDMLLPPNSGVVALPAHCVEQGRWTGRGSEDAKKFKSSAKCAVGNEMKIANYNGQQSAVWEKVSENQTKIRANVDAAATANASPTSFQLTLEAPAVQAKVAEYEAALRAAGEGRGVVGVVFAVNGQVTAAEVYGSSALFQKAWPKLLNAAAVEAVSERTAKAPAAAPSAREVERFLAYGANEEPAGAGTTSESRPEHAAAFTGRSGATRSQTVRSGGGTNDREMFMLAGLNDADTVQTVANGPGGAGQSEGRARQQVQGQPAANPAGGQPAGAGRNLDTATRLSLRGLGTQGRTDPASAQPASNDGNRLNSNRTENNSALVVESRDPARQNAVIHRSYLKK